MQVLFDKARNNDLVFKSAIDCVAAVGKAMLDTLQGSDVDAPAMRNRHGFGHGRIRVQGQDLAADINRRVRQLRKPVKCILKGVGLRRPLKRGKSQDKRWQSFEKTHSELQNSRLSGVRNSECKAGCQTEDRHQGSGCPDRGRICANGIIERGIDPWDDGNADFPASAPMRLLN